MTDRIVLAVAALIWDEEGRILLLKKAYDNRGWTLPGGTCEGVESPLSGCGREVLEELGVAVNISVLLAVDFCLGDEPSDSLLGFMFDGGTLSNSQVEMLTCKEGEIDAARFYDPSIAVDLLPDRMARRLRSVLAGQRGYLEGGVRPSRSKSVPLGLD